MKKKKSLFIFVIMLVFSFVLYIPVMSYSAASKPSAQGQGDSGMVKPSADSQPYPITAELHASPTSYTGRCPATIRFVGKITVPRPGKLRYRFIRSDNATAPVQTIAFLKAGSKMVSTSWRLGGPPLPSYAGWMAIQILDVNVESNKAEFRIQCAGLPGQQGNLPDLVIDDMKLDQNCNVMVRVRNAGPGTIPDEVWTVHKPESSSVYLTVDGKGWGGETIWKFDPDKHLKASGGTAIYRSTYRVAGSAVVQATVDHTKQINERSDANNVRTERLACQTGSTPLPDLVIDDMKLDQNCNVMVRVRNAGPGTIPDEVWTVHKPESSSVYLTVDGKGWGGETIWKFDPDKHLKASGGTAIYRSTHRVAGSAVVQATVDHTKQINERSDANNTRTERLMCQQPLSK